MPVVAVLGNHDYQSGHAEEVKKVLRSGKVVILEEAETFEIKGVGFAGAKGSAAASTTTCSRHLASKRSSSSSPKQ